MDGTIPRGALPKALARIRDLSVKYGLGRRQWFHAGDRQSASAHLYDANSRRDGAGGGLRRRYPALLRRARRRPDRRACVGIEKRDLMPEMFSEIDLNHSSG